MFPSNLHKNIVQLDKQISLLENECKNIETESKKKNCKPQQQQQHNKCSKTSRHSPGRVCNKKSSSCENSKCAKKMMPPFSARVKSTSSLQSTYSKPWSEFTDPLMGKVKKGTSKNKDKPADSETTQVYSKKGTQCTCCGEEPSFNILRNENNLYHDNLCDKKEEILHKEVLLSRSGERIEVTVTQKPNIDDIKENVPLQVSRKNCNHTPEQEVNCFCHLKRQKWSDILGLDSVKKKPVHKSFGSQTNSDETHCNPQSIISNGSKVTSKGPKISQVTDSKSSLDKIYEAPVKLSSNHQNAQKLEDFSENKELQSNFTELKKYSLSHLFEFLIDELQHRPGNDKTKILLKMESEIKKMNENKSVNSLKILGKEEKKNKVVAQSVNAKIESQDMVKEPCRTMKEEVELLSQELAEKNKIMAIFQKREEEYLSLISELRKNLERAKEKTHHNSETLKELDSIKQKFLEHTKISEALKKSHSKMQKILERYSLENDKLKTQIQIYKLESHKHDVLLAGKEAEIKRYKEEIQNFQRQISDHLSAIKSNAQAIDLEKMVEVFMHQSQLFLTKDDDVEKEVRESFSKQPNNKLLHSSPTSTKTSVVNSSWKQISSIREHNQNNIDFEINSDHGGEKEFFQIFGEDSPSNSPLKVILAEKLPAQKEDKNALNFTNCLSVRDEDDDEDDCGYSSTSKNDLFVRKESESLTYKKAQGNIEELLQQMKLKWSKEIRKPPGSGTIEDFFNSSQISSISMVSVNTASENT